MMRSSGMVGSWLVGIPLLCIGLVPSNTLAQSNDEFSVRDSAGILIVESHRPTGEADSWRLSPNPSVTIGVLEGPDEYILFLVQSGLVLENRKILVSNSGSQEIRVFSLEEGRFLKSFGRAGEGPGEFNAVSNMRVYRRGADSIAITDAMNGRVNVFDLEGNFGHSVSPTNVEGHGLVGIHGVFGDKRWLARMPQGSGTLREDAARIVETTFSLFAYDPDGGLATRLADIPSRPRFGEGRLGFPYVPLTPDPSFAAAGNDLLLSLGQDPEVNQIGPDGSLRAILRWNQTRTRVSEVWSRFSEDYLSQVDEGRRPAYSRFLAMAGLPIPALVPAVSEVRVDPLGFFWVQQYRLPWEVEPVWHILSPEGVWVGSMQTPLNVRILEIGEDYLLGRHRDELDIERVVVYSLLRSDTK